MQLRQFYFFIVLILVMTGAMDAVQLPVPMMSRQKKVEKTPKSQYSESEFQMIFEKLEDAPLPMPCYQIKTVNFQQQMKYHLVSHNLAGEYSFEGEFAIDEDGVLKSPTENHPFVVAMRGFQPGEPVEYFLLSEDREQVAKTRVVPWTIVKTDKFGHMLTAELINSKYSGFVILAEGLDPGEEIKVATVLKDKVLETQTNASREGTFTFMLMPGARSRAKGGEVRFELKTATNVISLTLPWGDEFRKHGEAFIKRKNAQYAKKKERLLKEEVS